MFQISVQVDYQDRRGVYDILATPDWINIECRSVDGKYSRMDRNYHSNFCIHRLIPLVEENLACQFKEYTLREVYRNKEKWLLSLMMNVYIDSVGNMNRINHTVDEWLDSEINIPMSELRNVFNEYIHRVHEPKKVLLDKVEYKENIRTVRGTKKLSREIGTICGICLEELKVGNSWAITKCNHGFHPKCIKRWLMKECVHPKCPMCNMDVRD